MDPSNLATKIAEALDEIVPTGFQVTERQGMVMIAGGATQRLAKSLTSSICRAI